MARGGLKRLAAGLEREIAPAVYAGAVLIEDEAKGSIMRGSVSGKGHVASHPNEAPNNDLGDLVRGIETTQPEPTRAVVSSNAGHAVALEYGTSKMAERPYMRPAAEVMRREAVKTIGRGVTQAVRKLGAG